MDKDFRELPSVLSAGELAQALGISVATAYKLLHRRDFPTLHVGTRLMVTRDNLLAWMDRNTNPFAAG